MLAVHGACVAWLSEKACAAVAAAAKGTSPSADLPSAPGVQDDIVTESRSERTDRTSPAKPGSSRFLTLESPATKASTARATPLRYVPVLQAREVVANARSANPTSDADTIRPATYDELKFCRPDRTIETIHRDVPHKGTEHRVG